MAEAQQARVQTAVEEMVQGLERDHIRKMQHLADALIQSDLKDAGPFFIATIGFCTKLGLMFRCSAECCERSLDSMSQVHQCIERCHTPLAQAQSLVTTELERFQDRLARCTMHCNDKAKDLFDSGAKEPAVRALMENCVGSCVDDHINLLPSMTRKLKDSLGGIPQ